MPTFNRAHFIAEALDAVTQQMGADDSLLVIDDGSTDDTAAVVAAYRPRVDYVRQDNSGKSAALNRALALTESEYVWICDDDDVTAPGAVTLLHDAAASHNAGFIFGRHTRFHCDGSAHIDLGTGYWPDLSQGSILRHMLEDSFVMQNAALIRRAALQAMGPFDEAMPRSIDYDMFVRLALLSPGHYVDALVFSQRKHDGLRGPQGKLHAAAASMDVWAEWDRRVFDKVAETEPLATFEGLFECEDGALLRRAALLQRACVWSRHHRWDAALNDLDAAIQIAPALPLHATERDICARILNGKHGFAALLGTGPVASGFGRILSRSDKGREVGWGMARGIFWMLRHHDVGEREQARAMLGRIAYRIGGRGLMAGLIAGNRSDRLRLRERSIPHTLGAGDPMTDPAPVTKRHA